MVAMSLSPLLEGLNDAQVQAVLHPLGKAAMVLAGAGSGKTKVLTTRAAYLIEEHHVPPSAIMLVTFTNKASQEMTKRVERLIGVGIPFAGTFHRLCARILRSQGKHVGIDPGFVIYDDDDQLSLMSSILKELGISTKEAKPRTVLSMISSAKNELLTPAGYSEIAKGSFQQLVARVYPIYQRRLKTAGAVDFDDLLMQTVMLFRQHPDVLAFFQHQFTHILVDEYQDTNTAQYELTKMLAVVHQNLFVVGDFSQAIYGWRGADYRNMLSLEHDFPTLATYKLEQNYRSTQSILDAASGVISNNTSHPVLALWTEKPDGEKIHLFEATRDTDEVTHVVRKIREYRSTYNLSDIVVLYRTNAQSRAFEDRLIAEGIPYKLVGGVRFYERKEVKDALSYVRLLLNPRDEISKKRIEKLGKRKLATFMSWIGEHQHKYVSDQPTTSTMSDEDVLHSLLGEELTVQETVVTTVPVQNALVVLDAVLEASAYLTTFDQHDEEELGRLENLQELRSLAAEFSSITSFLETIALVEQDAVRTEVVGNETDALTLMSVHAAKGLEFAVVFMVGMEEGLFPHSRSLLDPAQMEEERRLCYVAITRAKERLHISFARRRMTFGTVNGAIMSRFLLEIPPEVIERQIHEGLLYPETTGIRATSFPKTNTTTRRVVPLDDPSIDDFLSGAIDASDFLGA